MCMGKDFTLKNWLKTSHWLYRMELLRFRQIQLVSASRRAVFSLDNALDLVRAVSSFVKLRPFGEAAIGIDNRYMLSVEPN